MNPAKGKSVAERVCGEAGNRGAANQARSFGGKTGLFRAQSESAVPNECQLRKTLLSATADKQPTKSTWLGESAQDAPVGTLPFDQSKYAPQSRSLFDPKHP
ncbi:hypothetical protein SAMN06265222_101132 [Neorhodopirellula lusitana]|uniref:Uncharacterized protein n=1 Tax=Neorhodopirellula lusitana TaxID=445327 RepID=A0ABY1PQI6_9BACT|nr:hypothetical protein SAMN06265222_101132 [Neorhodopirellula lusitana]